MAASAADLVHFVCVKDGTKLRVRITSPGYHPMANCQFPRALRAEGREFTAPSAAVSFAQGRGGTLFYKVKRADITEVAAAAAAAPEHIFDVDPESLECVICMAADKAAIFIPCGHYCACMDCAQRLNKECPICRAAITQFINHNQLD